MFFWIKSHKKASVALGLIIVVLGYWSVRTWGGGDALVEYVTAEAAVGNLIHTVSGTGQVASVDQIELKTKAAGEVVYLGVATGERVAAGALILELDSRDAARAVRDAELNLANARVALAKLELEQNQQNRGDALDASYEEGLVELNSLYAGLGATVEELDDLLLDSDLSTNSQMDNVDYYANYDPARFSTAPNRARRLLTEIRELQRLGIADYQAAERGSGEVREQAIRSGYQLTVKLAELIKLGQDLVRGLQDSLIAGSGTHTKQSLVDSHEAALASQAATYDPILQNLLRITNAINSQRDSLVTQPVDLQTQRLAVTQRENALRDARETLADYTVRAPIAGTIAKLNVKRYETLATGAVVAVLVTDRQVAEIPLNEIDAAKVSLGQPVNLTFDAIEGLELMGEVAEIDAFGVMDQGVVSYEVKISFNEPAPGRIKAGMSVSAEIVTAAREGVLLVPSGAVKPSLAGNFVEVLAAGTVVPERRSVEVGATNDVQTEIISGLTAGERVVTRAIGANAVEPQAPSLFGGGASRGGGGGGAVRFSR